MEEADLLDLVIEQGSTFDFTITIEDEDGAVDLTGATARMQCRRTKSSDTTLFSLIEGSGITMDKPNGEIAIIITDEQTSAFEFQRGFYDLKVAYANGTVDRILEGRVSVSREVTR